ncbi:MAG: SDR family NAD(P)-dependent oxidoreductase [Gemmatimonadales bacterium]
MSDMNGKVALITGASSGIGRATAQAFSAKGVHVVLGARREDELATLAAEITASGGHASYLRTDVSVASDVERLVDHAVRTYERLDFGINNAGIEGAFAPIVDFDEAAWDQVIAINLKGTFLGMKYQARAMLKGGRGGAIVNVGSVNSFLGFGGGTGYATSKHGQVGLTTSASAELAPQGIRVNIICPGLIDTPMHHRIRGVATDQVVDDFIQGRVHLKRVGRSEEIAASIVFLCSDDASYITGTTLTPDGGFTMTL